MKFRLPEYGAPSMAWPYHDAQGQLVGYVCRWDIRGANGSVGKTILPVTFCELEDGRRAWRAAGPPREYSAAQPPLMALIGALTKRTDCSRIHVRRPGFSLKLEKRTI